MGSYARPNRLTSKKDKDYHIQFTRYILGQGSRTWQYGFVLKYFTNLAFYKGNQWIFEEDLDAFLKDESGDVRNRIKFVNNIIKPYFETLRGEAIKMDLNFEVDSISREAKNRRDTALSKLLFATKVATDFGGNIGNTIANNLPIGNSQEATVESFNNTWIDTMARDIKYLIHYVSECENDFEQLKVRIAEDMALSGLGVAKEDDINGREVFRRQHPANFCWDLSARLPDLSDASYMYDYELLDAADIFERWQDLKQDEKEKIERMQGTTYPGLHNLTDFMYGLQMDKVPVYNIYWRDLEQETHGVVMDKYGYPTIGFIGDKEGDYTEADLIPEDQLEALAVDYDFIDKLFHFKNKRKITIDYCRYCRIIPQIYSGLGEDIVLDYGIRNYSQMYTLGKKTIDYPYKCFTYAYFDGEVLSPLDSLISPQRLTNRILSMAEAGVANSRGAGSVIDFDAVDSEEGEEGIQRNINQSKTVLVNANGKGINNVLGSYDYTVKEGTLRLFDVSRAVVNIANDIVGKSAALAGGTEAVRASNGVNTQNLNQSITLQEPYFYAIYKVIFSCFDTIADRGRRIYASNQRELSIVVGDKDVVVFKITKDHEIEEFRIRLNRTTSKLEQRQLANATLERFLQSGLIDKKTFAAYYNCSDMQDVMFALRDFTSKQSEVERQMAEKAQRDQKANAVIEQANSAQQLLASQKQDEQGQQEFNADNQTKLGAALITQQGRNKEL